MLAGFTNLQEKKKNEVKNKIYFYITAYNTSLLLVLAILLLIKLIILILLQLKYEYDFIDNTMILL